MGLDLMRAVRRKQTFYGEKRPGAVRPACAKQTLKMPFSG